MQGLSQTVLTDTIAKTTLLDEKATIANGNLLKEGKGYKSLFAEQKKHVDSLMLQISYGEKENFTLRFKTIPSLQKAIDEMNIEKKHQKKNHSLEIGLIEAELEKQITKKWQFGSYGIVIGSILTLAIFLLTI